MNFNYRQLKNTITVNHLYLPLSSRLTTFLSYEGDLWEWALQSWLYADKCYRSCKGYIVE